MPEAILLSSIMLQFTAAALALRLVVLTGRWRAWSFIAIALALMGIRRSITFYRAVVDDMPLPPDLTAELIALLISILMVSGVFLIGPVFRRIQRTGDELRESREILQNLLDHSPTIIAIRDTAGRFKLVNRAYEKAYNTTTESLQGKTVNYLMQEHFAKELNEFDRKVIESGEPMVHEHYSDLKQGGDKLLSVRFPIRDDTGKITAVGSVATDVTKIRQTEASLREIQQQYQAVVEDQTEMISRHTPDGLRTFVNDSYCKLHGKSKEQLLGQSAYDGMSATDLKRLKAVYKNLTPQKPSGEFEACFTTPDGETIWQLWAKRAIFDEQGQVKEYQSVGRDITDRKRAEDALQAALAEAERANSTKSQFLATMSHEFRTPLNAILGFSEMLRGQYSGPLGADSYLEYADDIHSSGRHMLALVNDVLDISTIEAGKRALVKEIFAIDDVLKQCLRDVEKSANDNSINLVLELADDLPPLYADKRSVTQVIQNLLSNAIKFTDQNGSILISAGVTDGGMKILVKDTGIGIPADQLSNITEPFSQADSNPHRTQEGTGLGLSIVKSLVEVHDGTLEIASEFGKGTTVTVTFPVEPTEQS